MPYIIAKIPPIETTDVYTSASFSGDLSKLTLDSIVPSIIYLFMKYGQISQEQLVSDNPDIKFNFVEQPATQIINEFYDTLDPFVYSYIVTSIPRNHTDKFMEYQKNKAKGLIRQAEYVGVAGLDDEFIIKSDVLDHASDFFKRFHRLFSNMVKIVIGMANPDYRNAATDFATQMLKSIEYGNMVGVKLIEEVLLQPSHPILTDHEVNSYMNHYKKFKRLAMRGDASLWTYTALLNRPLWDAYSKSNHFNELWIYAAVIGYNLTKSYGTMVIRKKNVMFYHLNTTYISKILQYKGTTFQLETEEYNADAVAQVRLKMLAAYSKPT